jgi:hypothetical protein
LCGHPAGTNYITWSLCRHRRRVRTRLRVPALHWVLLHSTAGHLTRASPRSSTSGLLHRRRRTPGLQASSGRSKGTTGRSSRIRVGRRGSKVGALGPLGTTPRTRYLHFSLLDLVVARRTCVC